MHCAICKRSDVRLYRPYASSRKHDDKVLRCSEHVPADAPHFVPAFIAFRPVPGEEQAWRAKLDAGSRCVPWEKYLAEEPA